MTFQHRAGVRPYTSCCQFAESCVFDKQSLEPLHCDRLSPVLLLPKLRSNFAEFLNNSSLAHLRILSLTTCVRSRYGPHALKLAAFLETRHLDFATWLPVRSHSQLALMRGFAYAPATLLGPQSNKGYHYPDLSLHRMHKGAGISTCCPSATPFGLTLGPD